MSAGLTFLVGATAAGILVLVLVLRPLLRPAPDGAARASYDRKVFRDQLREIESDLRRGVVTDAEAGAVRVEISRRLLAAADAETQETGAVAAPRRATGVLVAVIALAFGLGATGLYGMLGAPGRTDQPLAARLALLAEARANRPTQARAEAIARDAAPEQGSGTPEDLALIAQLAEVLAARPDDIEGHRLLARSEAAIGRWPQARAAQERVIALLAGRQSADDLADLAEFMILSAGGYVSPEAEARLTEALERDPGNPVARYYSGLSLLQGGRPDLTLQLWSRLLEEGPPEAPWITPIAAQIDEVAAAAGQPAPPVPSRSDIEERADPERSEMILGMVRQLSERLASEGGPPEDWARLIRSLGVLGRVEDARSILEEARGAFAGDPAAMELIEATARDAGLGP